MTILKALFALALVYVLIVGALYVFQRRILFVPGTVPPNRADAGLSAMREVELRTADGLKLLSWYHAAASGRPTLVYFQGNAGTIASRGFKAGPMIAAGFGLLLVGYRGYGGNPGHPSETGLIEDGRAALAFLREKGVTAADTVLYGESLGTGVAVALAAEAADEVADGAPLGALILESPYTSIAEIAAARYRFAPVNWLIKDRFDTLSRIGRVTAPVLILHGEKDGLIGADHGRRVFAAANDPKELRLFAEGRHSDLYDLGALETVTGFLGRMWHPAQP